MPPRAALFAGALALSALAGCGGSDRAKPQDETQAIGGLVADVPDGASAAAPARQLFVTPPPPAELKRYAAGTFELVGTPDVSGDAATGRVRAAVPPGREGTIEWTFVRDGDRWKVKDAPLP